MIDYDKFSYLEEVFTWDKEKVNKELNSSFYQYYRRYFKDIARFRGAIDEAYHILKVTSAKDKKVLDLGCGYGLLLIQMNLFGSGEAIGIDTSEGKMKVFRKLISLLPESQTDLHAIRPCIGDILKIEYPDNYFDVVIARETISHVRDLGAFLKEVKRVLKPKGVFFIKDGNNSLDIYGSLSRRRLWKKHEFGPVEGTGLKKPYRIIRKEMIMERCPNLNNKILVFLVDKTIGMWGEELYKAVDNFLDKGILPEPPKFKYRNPKSGDYAELGFNPYYVKKLLEKIGYKARVIKPFYSYTYSGLKGIFLTAIGNMISLFHPASLFVAPTFEIIAEKNNY